ncbi:MAG: hypothetical protein ACPGJS_08920, partial [Flammeovirgaceae bacterium]
LKPFIFLRGDLRHINDYTACYGNVQFDLPLVFSFGNLEVICIFCLALKRNWFSPRALLKGSPPRQSIQGENNAIWVEIGQL